MSLLSTVGHMMCVAGWNRVLMRYSTHILLIINRQYSIILLLFQFTLCHYHQIGNVHGKMVSGYL